MAAVRRFAQFTERAKFLSKCYFTSQNGTLGPGIILYDGAAAAEDAVKSRKFALVGAMTGTATSAGYAYLSGSRRLERTSPWRDTVGDCIAQAQATCHSILEDYVPAGFYRFKFKTYIIPVSDMLFLL